MCRRCGKTIASTKNVFNVIGKPSAVLKKEVKQYSDETLALVQYFRNPSSQHFKLFTVNKADVIVEKQVSLFNFKLELKSLNFLKLDFFE